MLSEFYFPPHPKSKNKMPREELPRYEDGNFLAQLKFNGIHAVIYILYSDGRSKIVIHDRRGVKLSTYQLTDSMFACLSSLNLKDLQDYVFVGELLHTKAKSKITDKQAQTNTIVLFDVLGAEGRYLADKDQVQRLKILSDLCNNPKKQEPKGRGLTISTSGESELWLAEVFEDDFLYHFDEFFDFHAKTKQDKYPEIEGLILRDKDGMLLAGDRLQDVDWMLKVRKQKQNLYPF